MNDLKSYESSDKSLLVLDDDDIFRNRLITAMERKGFKPFGASSVASSLSEQPEQPEHSLLLGSCITWKYE